MLVISDSYASDHAYWIMYSSALW